MKPTVKSAKAKFGKGKFFKIKNVRWLSWEDAFDADHLF